MSRYARQEAVIGAAGQARLAGLGVLVVGAGGLGSALLPLLSGAGVGRITLVDPDHIEESNLHRQTLYRMQDIAQPKAQTAARALTALNPACAVQPLVARLGPALAEALVPLADVVVDAADQFLVSYALSDACARHKKPLVSASVLGRQGYLGGFCGGGPSYRALFPSLPATAQSCASGGVLGPAVMMLGALQAQMVLALALGETPSALGQLLCVDLAQWRVSGFRFDGAGEPEHSPAVIGPEALRPDDLLIELRDRIEAPQTHPQARRTLTQPRAGQRVVFLCASGLRAWRAAEALSAQGHRAVAVLAG